MAMEMALSWWADSPFDERALYTGVVLLAVSFRRELIGLVAWMGRQTMRLWLFHQPTTTTTKQADANHHHAPPRLVSPTHTTDTATSLCSSDHNNSNSPRQPTTTGVRFATDVDLCHTSVDGSASTTVLAAPVPPQHCSQLPTGILKESSHATIMVGPKDDTCFEAKENRTSNTRKVVVQPLACENESPNPDHASSISKNGSSRISCSPTGSHKEPYRLTRTLNLDGSGCNTTTTRPRVLRGKSESRLKVQEFAAKRHRRISSLDMPTASAAMRSIGLGVKQKMQLNTTANTAAPNTNSTVASSSSRTASVASVSPKPPVHTQRKSHALHAAAARPMALPTTTITTTSSGGSVDGSGGSHEDSRNCTTNNSHTHRIDHSHSNHSSGSRNGSRHRGSATSSSSKSGNAGATNMVVVSHTPSSSVRQPQSRDMVHANGTTVADDCLDLTATTDAPPPPPPLPMHSPSGWSTAAISGPCTHDWKKTM